MSHNYGFNRLIWSKALRSLSYRTFAFYTQNYEQKKNSYNKELLQLFEAAVVQENLKFLQELLSFILFSFCTKVNLFLVVFYDVYLASTTNFNSTKKTTFYFGLKLYFLTYH